MGIQHLPDGEPTPWQFKTVAEYAKAYIDWCLAKQLEIIERRLRSIERQEPCNER
jgi:hypothetical protein